MGVAAPLLLGGGAAMGAASNIAGGISQGAALEAQGETAQAQGRLDAAIFDRQADWERRAGKIQENQIHLAGKQLIGQQRAGYAAGNIDVNTGTPLNVQGDTQFLTKLDELMAKNNAWMRASGFELGAAQKRFAGDSAYAASQYAADTTRATSFLNAGSSLFGGATNILGLYGKG